jgi:acetyltransferase-like isoleucine patch superfamily enzyme
MLRKILYYLRRTFSIKKQESIYTKDLLCGEKIKIGMYSYGKPIVLYQDSGASLIIGKFCSIADNVTILLGGNHRTDWISTYPFKEIFQDNLLLKNIEGHPSTNGNVVIGNDVWIGRNVLILSGVEIADGAVIAAGSVVTKNVGAYEIWGGNPAKHIRKRFSEDVIKQLQEIAWWNWELDKIHQNASILCSNNVAEFTEKNIYNK